MASHISLFLWLFILQTRNFIDDDVVDDGLRLSTLVEEETCDVMTDQLNHVENQVTLGHGAGNILPTVEVDGHFIYKSTLVSQLNGNIFLSKDRLARIKLSIQFNNHDNCLQARSSCGSNLLSIGFNCGVHFVQRNITRLLWIIKSVAKQKRGCSMIVIRARNVTNILNGVDASSWWVGR